MTDQVVESEVANDLRRDISIHAEELFRAGASRNELVGLILEDFVEDFLDLDFPPRPFVEAIVNEWWVSRNP